MCLASSLQCRPSDSPSNFRRRSKLQTKEAHHRTLVIAVGVLLLLPTNCYLNRGFTAWFHWLSVVCWLSGSGGGGEGHDFLRRSLVLLGTSICIGWYASILMDYAWHGRPFMRLLYRNMPESLSRFIFHPESGDILYDGVAIMAMVTIHVLDFLGHPYLTYVHWYRHCQDKQRRQELEKTLGAPIHQGQDDVLTWSVILGGYLFSRTWSFVHNYYNFQTIDPFYTGFDVYNIDHVHQWIPAYVAETACFGGAAVYKLLCSKNTSSSSWVDGSSKISANDDAFTTVKRTSTTKPLLVYSESSMSEQSLVFSKDE